jgi:hypothetical protein
MLRVKDTSATSRNRRTQAGIADRASDDPFRGLAATWRMIALATFQLLQPNLPGALRGLRTGTAEGALRRQQGDSEDPLLVPPFGELRDPAAGAMGPG